MGGRGRPIGNVAVQIRVEGHLDRSWSAWFDGLAIAHDPNGETRLSGPLADQAVLHGVLIKIRDLGLRLIAVTPLDAEDPGTSGTAGAGG